MYIPSQITLTTYIVYGIDIRDTAVEAFIYVMFAYYKSTR